MHRSHSCTGPNVANAWRTLLRKQVLPVLTSPRTKSGGNEAAEGAGEGAEEGEGPTRRGVSDDEGSDVAVLLAEGANPAAIGAETTLRVAGVGAAAAAAGSMAAAAVLVPDDDGGDDADNCWGWSRLGIEGDVD
jgi:hypothetical protein